MEDKIFKVIKIIDEYNIVINAGANYKLKENDKLEVFVKGQPIKDLDTDVILGTLDTIKAKLIIKQVFNKFCICGNVEQTVSNLYNQNMTSALASIAPLFVNTREEKKLNIDPKEITGGFAETDDKIKIGDLVRKSLS